MGRVISHNLAVETNVVSIVLSQRAGTDPGSPFFKVHGVTLAGLTRELRDYGVPNRTADKDHIAKANSCSRRSQLAMCREVNPKGRCCKLMEQPWPVIVLGIMLLNLRKRAKS